MAFIISNNSSSTLAANVSTATQTSITLQPGHGVRFPSPTGGDYTTITLENSGGTKEIVCVVGRSTDVLTVGIPGSASANSAGRGIEGTTANTWITGNIVAGRATAASITRGANAKTAAELINASAGTHGAGLIGNFPVGGITEDTVAGALNGLESRKLNTAALPTELPAVTHVAADKATLAGADELPIADSAASFGLKKVSLTNLRADVIAAALATIQDGSETFLGSVAGADTITAAATPALVAQAPVGSLWKLPAAAANTGAATLNINAQGAVAIVRPDGTALTKEDIPAAGYVCLLEKRAADFVLLNPANVSIGRASAKTISETRATPAISVGELTLDLQSAGLFDVALNGNISTLTISNPPASGTPLGFTLVFTADGTARTVTWPASVKWDDNIAPLLTSTNGKRDVFTFMTYDAGTSYLAFISGQNK